MKKQLALLILFSCSLAEGQGGQVREQAIFGGGVPNAVVKVCTSADTACNTANVSLYSNPDLSPSHQIGNPTSADGAGNYIFYVAPGLYTMKLSSPFTVDLIQTILVPSAPAANGLIPPSQLGSGTPTSLNCLHGDGTWGACGPVLQTNGTPNGNQALLNLKNGTNITITDDGVGGITINSSGGGGGVTGSGTAGKFAVFTGVTSIGNSSYVTEDGSFFNVCYPAGSCVTGPFLQIGASSATGSIVGNGQSVTWKAIGNAGNINLRPGPSGGQVVVSGIAGIDAVVRMNGGTSGAMVLKVDPVADGINGTSINLSKLYNTCQIGTTCAASQVDTPRILRGRSTLSGGTATVTSIPAFVGTTDVACFGMDTTTPANTVSVTIASTTSITLTGTGSDAVNWVCFTGTL